jgi:hypothetical protein
VSLCRYRLTPEGHDTACECILRAGLDDSSGSLDIGSGRNTPIASHSPEHHLMCHSVADTLPGPSMNIHTPNRTVAKHAPEAACGSYSTKRPNNYNTKVQTTVRPILSPLFFCILFFHAKHIKTVKLFHIFFVTPPYDYVVADALDKFPMITFLSLQKYHFYS